MVIYDYKGGYLGYQPYDNKILFEENKNYLIEASKNTPGLYNNSNMLSSESEQKKSNPSTEVNIVFIVTYNCNFACKYCYEHPANVDFFDQESNAFTAENMIKVFLRFIKKYPHAKFNITFFGGEPFIEHQMIAEFISLANEHCNAIGKNIPNYIAITNGSLLNEQVRDLIINNFFGITVSLDGAKIINDNCRVYKNGMGSFDDVFSNIEKLNQLNYNKKLFLSCEATLSDAYIREYTQDNIKDSYRVFKELSFEIIGIIPVISNTSTLFQNTRVLENIISDFIYFWVYDILNDVEPARIITFVNIIGGFTRTRTTKRRCTAGITYFSVTPNMEIFPCQVSIFSDKRIIGKIDRETDELSINNASVNEYLTKESNPLCYECECAYHCDSYCKIIMGTDKKVDYPASCLFNKIILKLMIFKICEMVENGIIDIFCKNFTKFYSKERV